MSFPLVFKTSVLCVVLGAMCSAASSSQKTFDSPGSALKALVAAVRSENYSLFLSVAGTQMAGFWNSGEPEWDLIERDRFLDSARISETRADAHLRGPKIIYVGDRAYRFPAPLIYTGSGWRFDGKVGAAEVTARRIVRNEAAILELTERLREAEFTYAHATGSADGVFASRIRSTPGKHDGLFWSSEGEEDESPLGPSFVAAAYGERQPGEELRPLHGYYVRILGAQTAAARRSQPGRFALIAWPAQYGVDGLRSFMLNHLGEGYQKDLGPHTARVAERIEEFDPDSTWTRLSHAERYPQIASGVRRPN